MPIVAPLIDLFALYGLLFSNAVPVLAFWFGFNALQLALATFAFRMDKESLKPLWALPLQQFVYRQLMYIVIIESTVSAVVGARAQWRSSDPHRRGQRGSLSGLRSAPRLLLGAPDADV